MKKKLSVLRIFVALGIFIVGCASEEVREPLPEVKELSCKFNQLDGECKSFSDGTTLCSIGSCSEGDCQNGKGSMTFPGGSKLEGTFNKGLLNGAGSYEGCGESFKGTFKDNLKEKGVLLTKTVSKNGRELVQYWDGQFQNEKRNGKGIYYSSKNKIDNRDSNIYEGTFKDEIKNGPFMVYSNFTGIFPISENGTVLKSVYNGSQKISYINDRDKEEIESEERERKEEALRQERRAKQKAEKQKLYNQCSRECTEYMYNLGQSYGVSCRSKKCQDFFDNK